MRRVNWPALIALLAFAGLIYLANWMIANVGQCSPGGPCVLPVGFGLMAPSGVYAAALVLATRDALHETGGRRWVLAGVVLGALLSAALSGPLAVASGVAFALSELADWAVYAPLRERSRPMAVLASGLVGLVIDSALFLWLAFGSLDFIAGQVVGKLWATLAVAAFVWGWQFAGHRRAAFAQRGL
jgi:uncharacterized PurR-regulated membrane protein YhhQ (DUF165 family)